MNKILETLLRFSNQIKLYHWKTHIYARHKATDKFLKTFNENLDKTIESLQGSRNTRINDDFSLKFKKMTDANQLKINATPVFFANKRAYEGNYPVICNEGGTRSSKSYSIVQLLIEIAYNNPKTRISIVFQRLNKLKTYIFHCLNGR